MLRRCDSIVFSLRNSSAAICLLVLRSVTRSGDLQLALGERRDARVLRGRRAALLGAGAELAQLAAHLVALALASRTRRARARPRAATAIASLRSPAAASAWPRRPRAKAAWSARPRPRALGGLRGLRRGLARLARVRAGRPPGRVRQRAAGRCRSRRCGQLLGAPHVGLGRPRAVRGPARPGRGSPSRSSAPRGSPAELLAAEVAQVLEAAVELAELEQRRREHPGRPAAPGRHRAAHHPPAHARALLARLDHGVEVAHVVEGEAELEERPEEVVGVAGEARGLDRRLAHLHRLGEPALHLERVALHEHQRHQQPALARWPGRSRCRGRRARSRRRSARGSSRPSRGSRAPPAGAPARRRRGGRSAPAPPSRCSRAASIAPDAASPEGERGRGRGDQRAGRPASTAASSAAAAHLQRLVEVHLVEAVHRQLDLQRRGLRRVAPGGQLLPRAGEAGVGLVVAAQPVLHRGAQGGELDPPLRGVRGQQVDRLQQRSRGSARARPTERSAEASDTRSSTWRSRSAAGSSRSAASNQRAAAPGARAADACAGLEQHRDRRLVALAGGLLHVVRALGGGGAAGAPAPRRPARGRRAASRRGWTRRRPAAPAGGGR